MIMTTPEDRLRVAGLELPVASSPVGSYRMVRRVGKLLWVSGHGAFVDGVPVHTGKLGDTLTTELGAVAARDVMLHLLATAKAELGDLSHIAAFAKVVVLVNSTPSYTEQHLVANGATDFSSRCSVRKSVGRRGLPLGSQHCRLALPSRLRRSLNWQSTANRCRYRNSHQAPPRP